MTKIDQIAQAFAQGVKFAENLKLAMDAAKGKDDEAGHWVTVGEGEEARPVFIKDKKKAAKTESKKAESKKAESKPAQQRNESKAEKRAKQNYADKDEDVSAALKHLTDIDIPESDIKKLQHALSNERFKHKETISEQLRTSAVLTKRDQREAALAAYEIQGTIKDRLQKGELSHQEASRKLAEALDLINDLRLRTRAVKGWTQGILSQVYHGDMPTKRQADIVEANAHTVARLKRGLEKMARELK